MTRLVLTFLMIFFFQSNISNVFANPVKEKFEQATLAYGNGQYQKAIALYEEALKLYPNLAPAYNFLALCYREVGEDINKILEYFNKAIELDPNYAQAYDNLGKLYYSLGDFELARDNCLKAVQLQPDLVSAKLTLGWTYLLGLGDASAAVTYFKEVADYNQLPYAYFGLGMAYYMDEQRIMVMDMITKLREINEESFAMRLEAMVREKRYIGPKDGGPLFTPEKKRGVIVDDDIPSLADIKPITDMPVRIKKDSHLNQQFIQQSQKEYLSGKDRIQQLQENYQMQVSQ